MELHDSEKWHAQPSTIASGLLDGVPPHPTHISESGNMAATPLPPLTHKVSDGVIRVARAGHLSCLQVETVAYASQALIHKGAFFLGDATGVGKTRTALATALDLMTRNPLMRCLWVSCRPELERDVLSTLRLLEGQCLAPTPWRKLTRGSHNEMMGSGFSFTTYGCLRSHWTQSNSIFEGATAWLSKTQPYSLIILDEAHVAKTPNSATFRSVCAIQDRLPSCGVLYITATAASDVNRIGYMQRLGLFGDSPDDPFDSYQQCRNALRRGGMAALELVALHLKSRGLYVSRSLVRSPDCSKPLALKLSCAEIELYNACCSRWVSLTYSGHEIGVSTFSLRQNFFLRLLTAFKARSIIEHIKSAVEEGWSVVVSFQGTGTGGSNACIDIARHCNVSMDGLCLPPDALDTLVVGLQSAGISVAEITGRKFRREADGMVYKRTHGMINNEIEKFQNDDIHVALLSARGGTGISLHAHRGHRRRLHLILELPWSAEAFEQQCGRTHRADEASPPLYRVVTTDVPIDKRVAHMVVKRMHRLGALSRGDHCHHEDYTHSADSVISTLALRRAGLEILMREALAVLGVNNTIDLPRSDARAVLDVVGGSHHATIGRAACRCLSYLLRSIDDYGGDAATAPLSIRKLKECCAAVQALIPSKFYIGVPLRWTFRHHNQFSRECISIATTVVLCANHSPLLGRLPKEILESIIAMSLDDGWKVPPQKVIAHIRDAGICREMFHCVDPHFLMGRFCAVPVEVQRTVWSAIGRAIEAEEVARHDRASTIERNDSTNTPGAVDISRFCFPAGIPPGCELNCTAFDTTTSPDCTIITLELHPGKDATQEGNDAIEAALCQPNPIGDGTIGVGPRLYVSRGTSTLRVVVPKQHTQHNAGAWDVEIFSPGCVGPVARLTIEKWADYYNDKLTIPTVPVNRTYLLRQVWMEEATLRTNRRTQMCLDRRHVVKIITASAALHQWESSSKVLIKAAPPLTPTHIIGVAATHDTCRRYT